MTRYRLGAALDVAEGSAVVMDAGEQRLLVSRIGETFCAIDDVCTHDGGPLGQGQLFGNEIECPRHGARFDVCSGRVTRMPAVHAVRSYPLDVEGGDLYVEIEDAW